VDKVGLEFKLIIAYLIPGMLGLYACANYIDPIKKLLGLPDSVPQGSSILVVLTLAVASGMVINALTWAFVRPAIEFSKGKRRPDFNYAKVNADSERAFRAVIDNYYYYYQSYANMFTGMILISLAYIERFRFEWNHMFFAAAIIVVMVVLFCAASNSLLSTYAQLENILRGAPLEPVD